MKLRTVILPVVVFVSLFEIAIAQNPVPLINQPLVPDAIAPGSGGFQMFLRGVGDFCRYVGGHPTCNATPQFRTPQRHGPSGVGGSKRNGINNGPEYVTGRRGV